VTAGKRAPATDEGVKEEAQPSIIRVECACGKALQVKAEHAGKKIRCPGCQELVLVPSAAEEDEDRDAGDREERVSSQRSAKVARRHDEEDMQEEPDEEDDDRPRKKGKGKEKARSHMWRWVGIAAGILVLVGGGLAAWWLLGSGGPAADLPLVPADAQAFVSVRVAELWNGKMTQDLLKQLPPDAREQLTAVEKEFNMTIADIDRVTFVLQDGDKESFWVVFSTTKPYDRKKLLDKVAPDAKEQTHQGKTYHGNAKTALHFVDDKTLVFASEPGIKACLDHIASPRKDGPLAKPLKQARAKPHIVAGFAIPAKEMQKARQELQGNPMAAGFLPLLDVQHGTLALTVGEKEMEMELGFGFPDGDKAGKAKKALDDLKKQAESLLSAFKMGGNPEQMKLMNQIDTALKKVKIDQSGSDVVVAMKGEVPVAALGAGLLLPAVQKVREAAAATGSQNNLHQMIIGEHDFASSLNNQMFYPLNFAKDQTGKPLLSWRVHLLPFVEGDALYKQFHLNEPWDSPHNKQLLNKMPKIYEVPGRAAKQGETYYQVFTGPGSLFEHGWTVNLPGGFPKGTSQTVVFVEGATSVPWTKPDDIVLGPDPRQQIFFSGGRSMVALGDGSVRSIPQTMRAQTLRNAILRDGNGPPGPDW
jgi:hypothetical protein